MTLTSGPLLTCAQEYTGQELSVCLSRFTSSQWSRINGRGVKDRQTGKDHPVIERCWNRRNTILSVFSDLS